MEDYKPLACYFPTTVAVIDDQQNYLDSLDLKLDYNKFIPKYFANPKQALQFFQDIYNPDLFNQRCLFRDESNLDHRSIDIDVPAIRKEIYNPDRFSQISVVVLDYAMPDLNGLELGKLIRKMPFKILMLTGEADEKIAVQAFNEGIIDKFIRKDSPNFNEMLNATICDLQREYFQDLSSIIINSIVLDSNPPNISWLNDSVFFKLFHQFCKENSTVEYYLTDIYGSYLLLDSNANPSWLAVKNEEGMQAAYEIARDSDIPFPTQLLEEIKNREKLIYLFNNGGTTDDPKEAIKALHPAKKIERKATYYYTFIKNPTAYDINRNKIVSYKEYSKNINKLNL